MKIQNLGLSSKVENLLERFVTSANKWPLHADDWDLFYRFIIESHKQDEQLHETDIIEFMREEGFQGDYPEQIAQAYLHGWALLEQLDKT